MVEVSFLHVRRGFLCSFFEDHRQSLGFRGQRDDGGCEDVEISGAFLANGGS